MEAVISLLDFEVGERFEADLLRSSGCKIHDARFRGSRFFLLATFRRHIFHLNEDSVALVLESCLGGLAADFNVEF